jgi:RimJ/RimL family protein N-acetyltransferase
MKREDLDAIAQWRPFADPLYQPFGFPERTRADHYRWFDERRSDPTRRLYSVEDERKQVIGSLTLREMDGRRSARLGITLGADYVSHGYGTEAMRVFLKHFFQTMGFAQIVLDVAATNQRAVRCYHSLGFRQVSQHYQPANHPSFRVLCRERRYSHLRSFFRFQGSLQQVLFYDLVLDRGDCEALTITAAKCETP